MYLTLVEIGIQFLTQYLGGIKGAKVPLEVAAAVQAAVDALISHKNDIITKSNLEAMRG